MKEIQPKQKDSPSPEPSTERQPSLSQHIKQAMTQLRRHQRQLKGVRNAMGKSTIAELGVKIDEQTKAFDRLLIAFEKHVEQDRRVELKVEKLETTDATRTFHIRAIWTAFCAATIGFIFNRFFS